MRRALALTCLALACLSVELAPAAGAAGPAETRIGKFRVATTPGGRPSLLVPVTYPIETAGRGVRFSIMLRDPNGGTVWGSSLYEVVHAGEQRRPERRKRFVFVHRVDLTLAGIAALPSDGIVRARTRVRTIEEFEPPPGLGIAEHRSEIKSLTNSREPLCSTPSKQRIRPGRVLVTTLPICTQPTRWSIAEGPEGGSARIRGNRLIYAPGKKFRGTVSITLSGQRRGAAASVTPADAVAPVQITVAAAGYPVVRALGDSVTAGFGYYEKGELMPFRNLLSCKPGAKIYDDACSSNSTVRSNEAAKVEYSKDYGLSNNVSWAAQWANTHGITDYKNFAVSGSEPSDWFGEGQFAKTSKQIAGENPDYVLLTLGANPLLSNMLFGIGNIGCGIWADFFGRFQECIQEEFAEIKLAPNLKTVYTNLVKETKAQVFVMQYHLSIPTAALYGVEQIAEMGNLINAEIAKVANEVDPGGKRITVISPPHFNVGMSLGQAYPSKYKCEGEFFSSVVDGTSVQSSASQALMHRLHPIEFCEQPEGQAPWVISGDTGIHPSAAGYQQMASAVPAPK